MPGLEVVAELLARFTFLLEDKRVFRVQRRPRERRAASSASVDRVCVAPERPSADIDNDRPTTFFALGRLDKEQAAELVRVKRERRHDRQ